MLKRIILKNIVIIFSAVILLTSIQSSYADNDSFTVNVPNAQGGYTSIVIKQSGGGYIGPQGEYYSQFPSVSQLQVVYGLNAPGSTVVTDSYAGSSITVTIAPPALPVYVQPAPPASNYIWTPGYWRYDSFFEDYYWVPGTWVRAPSPGYLWTPGYWYWRDGQYVYRDGYWGTHVGFYGGINYGHGYEGHGFSGGDWSNGTFVNRTINETKITNMTNNNTSSFNGGPGGTNARPTFAEKVAMKEKHVPATTEQRIHMQTARKNPELRASTNHGKPAIAATARPGVFKGKGIVAAKHAGAFYNKTKPIKSGVARINTGAVEARHAGFLQHNKKLNHVPPKPKVKKPKVKKPLPKILQAKVDETQTKNPAGDTGST